MARFGFEGRPSAVEGRKAVAWLLTAILLGAIGCARTNHVTMKTSARATPCSYGGNGFVQSWRLCGAREHQMIIGLMLVNEFHFQYNFRHGQPYDVLDKGNGAHYFVDLSHARVVSRPGPSDLFTLPLKAERDGKTYILRWRIDGEFDTYAGSTPRIPLTRAPTPFQLKVVRP